MEEKKYYLKWCWIGWIILLAIASLLSLIPRIGWILYIGFLGWIFYMSVISVGVLEAKTFVLRGTRIPIWTIEGPKIILIPYPFVEVDYSVNLSTRRLQIDDLSFYDKDGFHIKIRGHIEMRVTHIFRWCYEFLGGETLESKEGVVKGNFGDAFQTLINKQGLTIKEIEKLRGPEICGLIFKGEHIAGHPFDPQEFQRYRENAQRQGWEVLTVIFASFEEVGKTREIREKQAIAAAERWSSGYLGEAEGERIKRRVRTASFEIGKAMAGIPAKKDSELTDEEKERISKVMPKAFQEVMTLEKIGAIGSTDKTFFVQSGAQIPLVISPPTTSEEKKKKRKRGTF